MTTVVIALVTVGTLLQDANPTQVQQYPVELPSPKLIKQVRPDYPEKAARAGFGGPVILQAQVDAQGRVVDARVLHGIPLLNEPALAAVKRWTYEPFLLNGNPTPFTLTVTVTFSPGSLFRGFDAGVLAGLLKGDDAETSRYAAEFVGNRAHQFRSEDRKKLNEALNIVLSRDPPQAVKDAATRALEQLSKRK